MKVRVKLDFTIEGPWKTIPKNLDRIGDFIEGGLRKTGVVGEDTPDLDLLPGSRVQLSVVRERKDKAR
jgi:hypothetical protein